jgi:DNA-binding CsgD family transcriptional regulator/tetratricopeptide (TPR) repeat protein
MFLAQVAGHTEDPPAALDHLTAARDALQDTAHSDDAAGPWLLSLCLSGRTTALIRADRVAEALEDGRRALDLARQIGIGGLEVMALASLSLAVWYDGDRDGALRLARQALATAEEFAGSLQRGLSQIVTGILTEAGDLAAAEQACAAALASCRDVGDLTNLCGALWHRTILDLRTGRVDDAPAHLRELFQIATQTGLRPLLPPSLDCCGHLCAATGRPSEALTVWAAMSALASSWPMHGGLNPERREELRRQAREQLGPARARAAEKRGAAMSLATATEYALLLAAEPVRPTGNGTQAAGDGGLAPEPTADGAALARLSPRERELVTLVARGHTDAQIAGQLYITVRTVSSHLDRVRDKTGCRRRADLTRLALSAGLV